MHIRINNTFLAHYTSNGMAPHMHQQIRQSTLSVFYGKPDFQKSQPCVIGCLLQTGHGLLPCVLIPPMHKGCTQRTQPINSSLYFLHPHSPSLYCLFETTLYLEQAREQPKQGPLSTTYIPHTADCVQKNVCFGAGRVHGRARGEERGEEKERYISCTFDCYKEGTGPQMTILEGPQLRLLHNHYPPYLCPTHCAEPRYQLAVGGPYNTAQLTAGQLSRVENTASPLHSLCCSYKHMNTDPTKPLSFMYRSFADPPTPSARV